jgi:hypothetical protein
MRLSNIIKHENNYVINTKLITVHSTDRDITKSKHSDEFDIILPENIKNIESLKLNSISIPMNTPVFSNLYQNTKFQFKIEDIVYPVEIADGTYTIEQLSQSIETLMNVATAPLMYRFKCKYNTVTNKLWFACDGIVGGTPASKEFTLLFDKAQEYDCDNRYNTKVHDKYFKWGLPAFIGYEKKEYTSIGALSNLRFSHETVDWLAINSSYIDIANEHSVGMIDILPDNNLYMEVDKYNSLDEISEFSKHNSHHRDKDYDGRVNSAFAKLPLIKGFYTLLSKSNSGTTSRHNPPIENISRLTFKFRFHDGRPLNLNNIPFSFIIEFNTLDNEQRRFL